MLSNTAARIRGRTRPTLLAAALPAVLAAVALPAAAEAATVEMVNSGNLRIASFGADAGEANNLRVSFTAQGIVFDDQVPIRSRDSECRVDAAANGICPGSATDVIVFTGNGNDTIQYTTPHRGGVHAGNGADTIFGGLRQAAFGRQIERVDYRGNDSSLDVGTDTVSYALANSRVEVDLADSITAQPILANDGRPGDREHIENDIEVIEGSNFGDTLFGSDRNDVIRGLNGNDAIGGGDGNDLIDEGSSANGADSINGGGGSGDQVSYGTRTSGVRVSLDGLRDDGAPGENDDVRPNVERVAGTNHADVLIGNMLDNVLVGFGGDDIIDGGAGNDELVAGSGVNRLFGNVGDDFLVARNGQRDTLDCGPNADRFDVDSSEQSISGCETRAIGVGTLRLTPKPMQAKAGNVARLRLSWRHPRAWRKLRTIELRLLSADGVAVGALTIRPRGERITDGGAVRLVRRASQLTRNGKTVTARLAVRLDESVAGQKLGVEVEATDTRGRRQLERDAGTVRVAK